MCLFPLFFGISKAKLQKKKKCFTTPCTKRDEASTTSLPLVQKGKMNKNFKEWEKEHLEVIKKYRGTTEFARMYIASLRRKPR